MQIHTVKRVSRSGRGITHSHSEWEFIVCVSGEGSVYIDRFGEYSFCPGAVITVPPNTLHYNLSESDYVHLTILFDGEELLSQGFVFFDDSSKTFTSIAELALRAYAGDGAGRERMLRAMAEAILAFLEDRRGSRALPREVERACTAMLSGFSNPDFRVSDAVGAVAYSKAHFRKLFRACTGMTLVAYLTLLRVRHACHLLAEEESAELSVSEIALSSGFSDVHYFSRVFHRETGMSPRRYRERFLGSVPSDNR